MHIEYLDIYRIYHLYFQQYPYLYLNSKLLLCIISIKIVKCNSYRSSIHI